jgi:hypothetical protein
MAYYRAKYQKRHKMSVLIRSFCRAAGAGRLFLIVATSFTANLVLSVPGTLAVDLTGLSQAVAIDQPQINLLVRNVVNGTAQAPQVGQTLDIGFDQYGNPIILINTTINITAYLDTGSSGLLLSSGTATSYVDSDGHGIPNSMYNGQTVGFIDIGVGGAANFTVSKPVALQLAPYTPLVNTAVAATTSTTNYYPQQIPAQLQLGPTDGGNSLSDDVTFDDINVVGMPALAGKTMVVDVRGLNNSAPQLNALFGDSIFTIDQATLDNLSLRTYVYDHGTAAHSTTLDTDPGVPATNLHVKVSYADFSGFTTTTPTGAPGPTLAHNPFIGANPLAAPGTDKTPGIRITFKTANPNHPGSLQTLAATGNFLFDTGAGASFISENMASKLHVRYRAGTEGTDNPLLETFDPSNPSSQGTLLANQFQEAIGGIGASVTVAGFYLDSLIVPTVEANPNNFTDPRNLHYNGTRGANGLQDVLGPPVLVQNITATKGNQSITLDGDFGVNFLVGSMDLSGTSLDNLVIGASLPGAFDWFTFDEPSGTLGLQLNSAFHIAGDFNGDGKLTNADAQGLLNAFKNIAAFKAAHNLSSDDWEDIADVNRDGTVNTADLKYLMNLLSGSKLYLSGDFNMDGKLTNADIQAMLIALGDISNFEASHDLSDQAWLDLGDVNGDGRVDLADETALMNLLSGVGAGGSTTSVPEPAAWQLAAIAAALCLLAARKIRQRRFLASC